MISLLLHHNTCIPSSNPQPCRADLDAVVLRKTSICRSEARLGQSMRIPFREDYVALHISLVHPQIGADKLHCLLSMPSA